MELYQRVEELGEANHEFLLRYNWEWFCSLNLQSGSDYPMAESKLKAWRIKMGIKDHMLIAYMGAFNTIDNPHIHLLLWGKRNRFGQTLLDLNPKGWEAAWSGLTKSQAVIEPIYEREGVASYIAKKNLPWDKSELIEPYNKRLLEKAMIG
jgi:hypothetical protein